MEHVEIVISNIRQPLNKPKTLSRTPSLTRFGLSIKTKVFLVLLIMWLIMLFVGENLLYELSITSCSISRFDSYHKVINLALVADPQLTDPYSYTFAPRGSALLPILEFYSDLYMKKSFSRLTKILDIHAVTFLGDLFDGGRILTDGEYENEFTRFNWVFKSNSISKPIAQWYIPGNHDIGYRVGSQQSFFVQRWKR